MAALLGATFPARPPLATVRRQPNGRRQVSAILAGRSTYAAGSGRHPAPHQRKLQGGAAAATVAPQPRLVAAAAGLSQTSDQSISVRETEDMAELKASSELRAECYYEDYGHVRFVKSFMTQFGEQEFRALSARADPAERERNKAFEPARIYCLVAMNGGGKVVGTCDVREPFIGDDLEGRGAYVSSVCVSESARRRGIGRAIMGAAAKLAAELGAERVYTHVHEDNEGAVALYTYCGFEVSDETELKGFKVQVDSAPGIGLQLGQTVLMRSPLPLPGLAE